MERQVKYRDVTMMKDHITITANEAGAGGASTLYELHHSGHKQNSPELDIGYSSFIYFQVGDPKATSYQDARGLTQVLHSNAKYCGFTKDELYDEEKNIICGVRLFAEALKNQRYNLIDALKEYHGGANKKEWGAKTNAYPNLVLTALSKVK